MYPVDADLLQLLDYHHPEPESRESLKETDLSIVNIGLPALTLTIVSDRFVGGNLYLRKIKLSMWL